MGPRAIRFGLLALMAALCLPGCILRDVDQNGTLVVAVVGDSNSISFAVNAWPEQLPARLPSGGAWRGPDLVTEPFDYANFAVPSTGVCNDGGTWGAVQLAQAQAAHADVILDAFGDLTGSHTAAEYIACHQAVVAAAAPLKVFIATTHHVCPPFEDTARNAVIDETNALIRASFPAQVIIDFDTGFDCAIHMWWDGVHLNQAGQDLRAERAVEALKR